MRQAKIEVPYLIGDNILYSTSKLNIASRALGYKNVLTRFISPGSPKYIANELIIAEMNTF